MDQSSHLIHFDEINALILANRGADATMRFYWNQLGKIWFVWHEIREDYQHWGMDGNRYFGIVGDSQKDVVIFLCSDYATMKKTKKALKKMAEADEKKKKRSIVITEHCWDSFEIVRMICEYQHLQCFGHTENVFPNINYISLTVEE